jgi:hypothetical protein
VSGIVDAGPVSAAIGRSPDAGFSGTPGDGIDGRTSRRAAEPQAEQGDLEVGREPLEGRAAVATAVKLGAAQQKQVARRERRSDQGGLAFAVAGASLRQIRAQAACRHRREMLAAIDAGKDPPRVGVDRPGEPGIDLVGNDPDIAGQPGDLDPALAAIARQQRALGGDEETLAVGRDSNRRLALRLQAMPVVPQRRPQRMPIGAAIVAPAQSGLDLLPVMDIAAAHQHEPGAAGIIERIGIGVAR